MHSKSKTIQFHLEDLFIYLFFKSNFQAERWPSIVNLHPKFLSFALTVICTTVCFCLDRRFIPKRFSVYSEYFHACGCEGNIV